MAEVLINGAKIYYESIGEGEMLVMIHGLGGTHDTYRSQVDYFSQSYRCITYDLRGYGQSDRIGKDYSFALLADDLFEFISSFKINRINLLGISMGGMIAQQYTLKYPETVKKLVLVSTASQYSIRNKDINLAVLEEYDYDVEKLAKVGADLLFPGPKQEEARRMYIVDYCKNSSDTLRKNMKAIKSLNFTDELNKITVPTLVIHGAKDQIIPLEMAEMIHAKMENSKLYIFNQDGHIPHRSNPEKFNRIVENFLYHDL